MHFVKKGLNNLISWNQLLFFFLAHPSADFYSCCRLQEQSCVSLQKPHTHNYKSSNQSLLISAASMQPSKEHDKYMVSSDQGFTGSSAKYERMSHNSGGLPPDPPPPSSCHNNRDRCGSKTHKRSGAERSLVSYSSGPDVQLGRSQMAHFFWHFYVHKTLLSPWLIIFKAGGVKASVWLEVESHNKAQPWCWARTKKKGRSSLISLPTPVFSGREANSSSHSKH